MKYTKFKVPSWWRRGKYNGKPLVGFRVLLRVNVFYWRIIPYFNFRYANHIHWLCFMLNFDPDYDFQRESNDE